MSWKCKIFGHKWDTKTDSNRHNCVRCMAFRIQVVDRLAQCKGEKFIYWKTYEMPN